jgi:hypothetical protein
VLPLVVHQNTGGEELGCSRWSFTRIIIIIIITPSFFGNVGYTSSRPLHPLQKLKDGDRRRHIYWGGGARVLPLVVHQNKSCIDL